MKPLALFCALLLCACSHLPRQAVQAAAEPGLGAAAQSDLYLGVVDGLIHQHRYQAAIAFLAKYQKTGARSARFSILAGEALSGAGRYDEAIASYRGALQSPDAAQAYNGIGKAQGARGSWGEAAENFRKASELDPANADYLNNLGYAQLKETSGGPAPAQTVEVLQRAHELSPDTARITANLALAMARSGRHAQFITLLDTIPDPANRRMVADLAATWTPGPAKGSAP
jgi:tetratricopeptide (TPR) repeat protein